MAPPSPNIWNIASTDPPLRSDPTMPAPAACSAVDQTRSPPARTDRARATRTVESQPKPRVATPLTTRPEMTRGLRPCRSTSRPRELQRRRVTDRESGEQHPGHGGTDPGHRGREHGHQGHPDAPKFIQPFAANEHSRLGVLGCRSASRTVRGGQRRRPRYGTQGCPRQQAPHQGDRDQQRDGVHQEGRPIPPANALPANGPVMFRSEARAVVRRDAAAMRRGQPDHQTHRRHREHRRADAPQAPKEQQLPVRRGEGGRSGRHRDDDQTP